MNPGPVLAELEGMDVLTTNDVAGIKLNAIVSDQVDRLIDCLLRKSDHAFTVFLEILHDIDEPCATILLEAGGATAGGGTGTSEKHYCLLFK